MFTLRELSFAATEDWDSWCGKNRSSLVFSEKIKHIILSLHLLPYPWCAISCLTTCLYWMTVSWTFVEVLGEPQVLQGLSMSSLEVAFIDVLK